jgi:hypothetical protein
MDILLFFFCSFAGLVMIGGSLFLLWKGRIHFDKETQEATELEVRFLGKLKTPSIVVVLFFIGLVMLLYPVYQARNICKNPALHDQENPQMVTLTGRIISKAPIDAYAVFAELPKVNGEVIFNVPFKKNTPYRVMYLDGAGIPHYSNLIQLGDKPENKVFPPVDLSSADVPNPDISTVTDDVSKTTGYKN